MRDLIRRRPNLTSVSTIAHRRRWPIIHFWPLFSPAPKGRRIPVGRRAIVLIATSRHARRERENFAAATAVGPIRKTARITCHPGRRGASRHRLSRSGEENIMELAQRKVPFCTRENQPNATAAGLTSQEIQRANRNPQGPPPSNPHGHCSVCGRGVEEESDPRSPPSQGPVFFTDLNPPRQPPALWPKPATQFPELTSPAVPAIPIAAVR